MNQEVVYDVVKGLVGVVIVLGAILLATSVDFPLESLIKVNTLAAASLWLKTFAIIALAIMGLYITSLVEDRKLFIAFWAILVVLSILLLRVFQLDDLSVISLVISGIILFGKKPETVGEVWGKIRSERGIATIIFLVLVTAVILPNAQYYNSLFIKEAVNWANSFSPSPQTFSNVIDAMFPATVTPQEVNYLVAHLRESIPEWNTLPPSEKNLIIQNAIQQLKTIKETLKNALKQSLEKNKPKLDEKTLMMLVEQNPKLSLLMKNLYLFLIIVALAVFSILEEIASILVFLIVLPFEWLRIRNLPKKEKEC